MNSSFESTDAYWQFAKTVRTERRFIFDGKAGDFIAAARSGSKSRAYDMKKGKQLFRAQIGSVWKPDEEGFDLEHPHPESRMIPDPKYIKNGGRANPPGFPYLYLANSMETALAEIRPWMGESVTLAAFEVQRDIKLVMCRTETESSSSSMFEETLSAEQIDESVWGSISKAFSTPANREDQEGAYLPTQILAEAFMAEGFDGVAYRTGLERGMNVVLFDSHVAKPFSPAAVYTLKKVRYDFESVLPYAFMRKGVQINEIHTESP